ncbi:hypothetical protein EON82_16305 [bacterium]|nr:MAG: hypothetical protein EON82_16305 [bacterium]
MAYRSNPAVGARLLEGDRNYRLSLSGVVVADIRDAKTQKVNSLPLPDRVFKLNPPAKRVADGLPALPTEAPMPPEKSEGPIDIGNGIVMPLINAVDQATMQGETNYQFDRRLSQCPVFVKGRFTPDTSLAALKLIGTVQSPDQRRDLPAPRLDSLNGAIADDDTPQSVRELLKEKNEKPLAQIMRETTSLSAFLGNLGIPMDSTVRLRVVPTLWLVGPGSVVDSGSTASINGVPTTVLVANQVGLTLDP